MRVAQVHLTTDRAAVMRGRACSGHPASPALGTSKGIAIDLSSWVLSSMGRRNYLIEGLSGTGKTSVCDELQRRGYPGLHRARQLAFQGEPGTGGPAGGGGTRNHPLGG